jgi:hypothetical protein
LDGTSSFTIIGIVQSGDSWDLRGEYTASAWGTKTELLHGSASDGNALTTEDISNLGNAEWGEYSASRFQVTNGAAHMSFGNLRKGDMASFSAVAIGFAVSDVSLDLNAATQVTFAGHFKMPKQLTPPLASDVSLDDVPAPYATFTCNGPFVEVAP